MPVTTPLKAGYFVYIQAPLQAWYKVVNPEPFNYRTGDGPSAEFSSLAGGAQSGFINISNLEPDKSPPHLFYVVPGVEDTEVRYNFKIPAGTDRLGTDVIQNVGFLDAIRSPFYAPNPAYAMWLIADYYPAINANNLSNESRTPRVWFAGYKYDLVKLDPTKTVDAAILAKLDNGQIPSLRINIGGVQTSSGVN
jgi:hypothetical protein